MTNLEHCDDNRAVLEDAELVSCWAGGCNACGATFVGRHFDAIHRFFTRRAIEQAADLTQATFLTCLEQARRTLPTVKLRAYLFGIARHQLLHYYRASRTAHARHASTITNLVDHKTTAGTRLAQKQKEQAVLSALRALPVDMQLVLELTYWEGLSSQELATVLSVPCNTVHSRIHRAKARLRIALEQFDTPTRNDL